jgi:diguanylate cyclase
MRIELPSASWRRVFLWTFLTLFAAVPLSIAATNGIMTTFSGGTNLAGLAAAASIPVLLGGPTTFYLLIKHQQLKQAIRQLEVHASTDWLTGTLNRRAFTTQVATHLIAAPAQRSLPAGALLVVDADEFKHINDRHGHDRGDEALQQIAATIGSTVREGDLVGRLGGEEFGVFLVGADLETARSIAERIRHAISAIAFSPDGATHPLSVSVGGAAYNRHVEFSDLFRLADQRLYEAKQSGRNRCAVASFSASLQRAA